MAEPAKVLRRSAKRTCAIYTRKSSEEGLDQAFNSLDAQREACAAFILSQRHEGWTAAPALYDDGGFSGGTMQRPALQRLMTDIEAGQIDVVVVYKVDRLTRALSDFARLVDVFDRRSVSFVSITQQFNTTTSMGRLTLNVLLSFAQFEREVIGERVRDKIAASKKKGMWMGGMPPMGYDVQNRKLVVNEAEAQIVVNIFQRYLALKSVHALRDALAESGIKSKRRLRPDGSSYGNQTLSRGALYLMLQNRAYRGEVFYQGHCYPGEHLAIVDQALWDAVQAALAANRVDRVMGTKAKTPSLLAGMLIDAAGQRLTPTHAVKKGVRYRYYVSISLITGAKQSRNGCRRIPAGDLERLVIDRMCAFFADPAAILEAFGEISHGGSSAQPIERGRQIAEELQTAATNSAKATLLALRCQVKINSDRIDITLSRSRLARLLDASLDLEASNLDPSQVHDDVLTLTARASIKRVGRGTRMLVKNADDRAVDPSLLRILARAHAVQSRLMQNPRLTVRDIAGEEKVSAAHLYTILRLAWLAPDIVTSIVNGRTPQQLNAKKLTRMTPRLPADWIEQRSLLGFR